MKAFKVTVNFTSFWADPLCLGYLVGHRTIPKIGKIFVFKDQTSAEQFVLEYKHYLDDLDRNHIYLLYGEAENCTRIVKVCGEKSRYVDFWTSKNKHKMPTDIYTHFAPKGTFGCTAFTPEKIVPFSWDK